MCLMHVCGLFCVYTEWSVFQLPLRYWQPAHFPFPICTDCLQSYYYKNMHSIDAKHLFNELYFLRMFELYHCKTITLRYTHVAMQLLLQTAQ